MGRHRKIVVLAGIILFVLLVAAALYIFTPFLFIMGDRAHSRFFSENAYAAAAEPKEIYNVEYAEHIDLYDRVDRIPFDKLESFFQENLK